eukprot:TRINITY_DN78025_c0_g1_i1.p1 TRINITY_DN78025_c0_g1~~TRINITY_DN78025_c0_g1_i1.p1  ORF type:complete len:437 (-),score=66.44 TRINITY_DN78025_c0_g1_i1:11-1321(-)
MSARILATSRSLGVELSRHTTPGARRLAALALSGQRRGQTGDDLVMGERAAKRANEVLDKIGGMYVSKNIGYSKRYADSYGKVFGQKASTESSEAEDAADAEENHTSSREVSFTEGPLGLEIEWTAPPVIVRVFPDGPGESAGLEAGQQLLQINDRDVTKPLPDIELDALMTQRPLRIRVGNAPADVADLEAAPALVQRLGYAKVQGALRGRACGELFEFVLAERSRCISKVRAEPTLAADLFSNVQTPRAGPNAPLTRWDMRLPVDPTVYNALQELLGGQLGSAFEELCGGTGAELWELGAVVSEPGAAPQPVHFDAAEECLYTAFVALQPITYEMGPTHFLPGTNTKIAHEQFEANPGEFVESLKPTAAVLEAGDAVIYDSRILHCGGQNVSNQTRALLYITFRHPAVDAKALGIHQHSIRASIRGKFRLRHFR